MECAYISGKMTGKADYGRKDFRMAEIIVRKAGYEVVNPAMLPIGKTYEQYMSVCLPMVAFADFVVLLPDWENSEGAKAEVAYATCLRKKIVPLAAMMEKAEAV